MKRIMLASSTATNAARAGSRFRTNVNVAFLISFSRYLLLIIIVFLVTTLVAVAQDEASYKKVVTERSEKIVSTLSITDSGKYKQVVEDIANQYINLNKIHDQFKASSAAIKNDNTSPKEATDAALKTEEDKKKTALLQLHDEFIAQLKTQLTATQIEEVKDGMTYRVFPITYAAYQDMLPSLTNEQKNQIYNWLNEARELAMDAGSSDQKHAVFGKYKGKINNYLSAAGYDMKKEGDEWQKRIKARQSAPNN